MDAMLTHIPYRVVKCGVGKHEPQTAVAWYDHAHAHIFRTNAL